MNAFLGGLHPVCPEQGVGAQKSQDQDISSLGTSRPLTAPPLSERLACFPWTKVEERREEEKKTCRSLTCSARNRGPTENGVLSPPFPSDNEVKESIFQKELFFSIHGRATSSKQQNEIGLCYLSSPKETAIQGKEIIPIWLLYAS